MGEMVSYRSNGGTSEGYLAIPAGGAASPAVIVIQEWWGLVPHIRSVADRFAEAGFVALAPDFYHGEPTSEPDEPRQLLMGMRMDEAAKDIAGAADYLAGRPEVTGKVGAVGLLRRRQPGPLVGHPLRADRRHRRLLPRAALGGRCAPSGPTTPARPPSSTAPKRTAPPPPTACRPPAGPSRRPAAPARLYDYPGTSHAFFNDDRPEAFDQRAAASAWARTLELFRAKLG